MDDRGHDSKQSSAVESEPFSGGGFVAAGGAGNADGGWVVRHGELVVAVVVEWKGANKLSDIEFNCLKYLVSLFFLSKGNIGVIETSSEMKPSAVTSVTMNSASWAPSQAMGPSPSADSHTSRSTAALAIRGDSKAPTSNAAASMEKSASAMASKTLRLNAPAESSSKIAVNVVEIAASVLC